MAVCGGGGGRAVLSQLHGWDGTSCGAGVWKCMTVASRSRGGGDLHTIIPPSRLDVLVGLQSGVWDMGWYSKILHSNPSMAWAGGLSFTTSSTNLLLFFYLFVFCVLTLPDQQNQQQ